MKGVKYKERVPHASLQDYVNCFWIMEREYTQENPGEDVTPDAFIELILNLGDPYVLHAELKTLPREIREFEPLQSLTDNSDDGLGLVRRLAADAHTWLKPGGVLLVEVGTYLSRRAQSVLRAAQLVDVSWVKDSLGVTRVVSGKTPR